MPEASPTTVAMGATINFDILGQYQRHEKRTKKGIFCNVFKVLCISILLGKILLVETSMFVIAIFET